MKVKYWIRTDKQQSECHDVLEVDDGEWGSMSNTERENLMKEAAFNHLEWGFQVVDSPEGTAVAKTRPHKHSYDDQECWCDTPEPAGNS
jgi:hypothetical protein